MTKFYQTLIGMIFQSVLCSVAAITTSYAQGNSPGPSEQPLAGMVDQPCPPALEMPAEVRSLLIELFIEPRKLASADFQRLANNAAFKSFEGANRSRGIGDWPGRCQYHGADATTVSGSVPPRIVFMGDSITENWGLADPGLFSRGVLDRGISGQTSEQMLVRFWPDVVALHPRIVLILAGTNDIAGNTGPTSAEYFRNNIMAMVEIARANAIEPVLCSIPPTAAFSWRPQLDPRPWIRQLNVWLRAYASHNHLKYLDYYALLAGTSGEFRTDLSNDGVHPNRSGYGLMRALVERAILSSDQ